MSRYNGQPMLIFLSNCSVFVEDHSLSFGSRLPMPALVHCRESSSHRTWALAFAEPALCHCNCCNHDPVCFGGAEYSKEPFWRARSPYPCASRVGVGEAPSRQRTSQRSFRRRLRASSPSNASLGASDLQRPITV